jgi:hypothetical protein
MTSTCSLKGCPILPVKNDRYEKNFNGKFESPYGLESKAEKKTARGSSQNSWTSFGQPSELVEGTVKETTPLGLEPRIKEPKSLVLPITPRGKAD